MVAHRPWIVLVAGLTVGAAMGWWLTADADPETSHQVAPEQPDLPIARVDLGTADADPVENADLRIVGVGTHAGFVQVGETAHMCARVVDNEDAPVEGARITFHADPAHLHQVVATGPDGFGCATFTAPPEPGTLMVSLNASSEDHGEAEATKSVEVLAAPAVHGVGATRTVPGPGAWAAAATLAAVAFLARGPRRTRGRGIDGPRSTAVLVAALMVVVALVPASAAQGTYEFGTTVGNKDYDYTPMAKAVTKASLCALDEDGNGVLTPGEPLFLDVAATDCGGRVGFGEIRIIPIEGKKAGTKVKTEDVEYGRLQLGPVDHFVRYVDLAGAGKVTAKTPIYLDLFQFGASRVGPGDVRLTTYSEFPPGSVVRAGDPDVSFPLSEVGGSETKLTHDNVLYVAAGTTYVNVDKGEIDTADTAVEDNDVRLTSSAFDPFAAPVVTPGPVAESDVRVRSVTASTTLLRAGEPFQVFVQVENGGSAAGAALVATSINGVTLDARGSPLLAPGQNATLVVTLIAPPAGPARIAAGNVTAQIPVAEVVSLGPQLELYGRLLALERMAGATGARETTPPEAGATAFAAQANMGAAAGTNAYAANTSGLPLLVAMIALAGGAWLVLVGRRGS